MIQDITLENFKGFKRLDQLNIKPITILCGTNSSGKSSILQSILLLKQTLDSKNNNQTLLLNGRFVHLGTFENIIYQKKIENNVVFNFKMKITKEDGIRYFVRELAGIDSSEYLVQYKVSLSTGQNSSTFIKPIIINKIDFIIETKNKDQENTIVSIELTLKTNGTYYVKWNNLHTDNWVNENKLSKKNNAGEIQLKIEFANLCPISFHFAEDNKIEHRSVLRPLYMMGDLLKNIFNSYTYIGPLREEPSRRYIYEDEIVEIGIKGENAAYIYLAEQEKYIYDHFIYNNENLEIQSTIKLGEAVDYWLNFMGIKELKPESINDIIQLNLQSSSSEKVRVSIADVGFGVSQIFPIILEGLRMKKQGTLLLEQPEIHLHPKLQMQMADYFIALALSNKNVIVETHSDHIINRLVRRVVEDESGFLKNYIQIYFISSNGEGSIYEEVKLDDTRGIINWPVDFFDQTATEQERIIQAGIKKRSSARLKENRENEFS
jgi:predicted ATPase